MNSEGQMPIDVERKNEFLEPIVFKYDGKSNQRVEREIIKSIESSLL